MLAAGVGAVQVGEGGPGVDEPDLSLKGGGLLEPDHGDIKTVT